MRKYVIGNGQWVEDNRQMRKGKIIQSLFSFCFVFFALSVLSANAQKPITLQQAVDTALVNNLSVKNERLKAEYHKKLTQSGTDIPVTGIHSEYGQINSYYSDLSLGVSQTISFPTVYASQKKLLKEEWENSVLMVDLKEAELKKHVSEAYFNLAYLFQTKNLLLQNDSMFVEFLDKATARFNAGESNVLEKITAENQRGQIALQLYRLKQDTEIAQLQFQLLLNTETIFAPSEYVAVSEYLDAQTPFILLEHPLVKQWKQQHHIAEANRRVAQSKLLPELTFGYNIMGMKGMGANDVEYNNSLQFQAVQFGLGIPIFNRSQRAKISAAKIDVERTLKEYKMNLKSFETSFATVLKNYQLHHHAVQYFESTALNNASIIKTTANTQFDNGAVDYLEWVLLMNQAITIQSEYIEAIHNRNNSVAEINFYLNK